MYMSTKNVFECIFKQYAVFIIYYLTYFFLYDEFLKKYSSFQLPLLIKIEIICTNIATLYDLTNVAAKMIILNILFF